MDSTKISSFLLCDSKADCSCGDDEEECKQNYAITGQNKSQLPSPSQLCLNIISNLGRNQTFVNDICPNFIYTFNESGFHCINHSVLHAEYTLNFTSREQTVETNYSYSFGNKCLFVLDTCGQLQTHSSGMHLTNCEDFICNETYFKCQGFYCIPYRYVCNKIWDCPGGLDENNCERLSCPGQFKCYNSTICVQAKSLCDKINDCQYGDDQLFCNSTLLKCPNECQCLLFSLACNNVAIYHFSQVNNLNHVFIAISKS